MNQENNRVAVLVMLTSALIMVTMGFAALFVSVGYTAFAVSTIFAGASTMFALLIEAVNMLLGGEL